MTLLTFFVARSAIVITRLGTATQSAYFSAILWVRAVFGSGA